MCYNNIIIVHFTPTIDNSNVVVVTGKKKRQNIKHNIESVTAISLYVIIGTRMLLCRYTISVDGFENKI